MNPEVLLIKYLCKYENYKNWRNKLDVLDFSKEVRPFISALDSLFVEARDVTPSEVSVAVFKKAKTRDRDLIAGILEQLPNADEPPNIEDLLQVFHQAKILRDISVKAFDAATGNGTIEEVHELTKKLDQPVIIEPEFVTTDLSKILENQIKRPGLRWRLNILNKSLGSLRKGDFGFIFARPETGKTTFLTSEVSHMALQCNKVLWINNEEQGDKVMFRVYQAVLGANKQQILKYPHAAQQKFDAQVGGKIRMIDDAGISKNAVENLCEQVKPDLIVIDQIDKIKGFNADREDLTLGKIYIWGRELAKLHAPVIGVCQADGTAEGVQWLHMGHVANAKTSKQAEADWIMGIGVRSDQGFENVRYLNICKNKLTGDEDSDEFLRHGKLEVVIEPEIARYADL